MTVGAITRGLRPSDAFAFAFVIGAFAVGAVAYDVVPAEMLIHYTPAGGVYYGIETVPKAVGLFVVPVVTAVAFAVARALPLHGEVNEALGPIRPYYQLGLVVLVTMLFGVQVLLVLLNL